MSSMRTIRITGNGQKKLRPDTTRVTILLEGSNPEYGEILRRSAQDTDCLKEILADFGFERSDLKTLNFHVDTEYESYKEKNTFKKRLVGYRFRHQMKVEFASDRERLGKILHALSHCPVMPELAISYTVKDPEAAKNELLGKAIADAKEKAAALTAAAGVELKDIQSIDYSRGEIELEVRPMNYAMAGKLREMSDESCNLDIEPDDIEISDTVTVVWEIR